MFAPPPSEVVWMGKLAFMWNLTYLLFMFCIVCIKNSERENKLNLLQTIFKDKSCTGTWKEDCNQ